MKKAEPPKTRLTGPARRGPTRAPREAPSKNLLWDNDAFIRRIKARVTQLGVEAQTVLKGVGSRYGDEIRKAREAKIAPRMDSVMWIAKALNWTLGQALGYQDPTMTFDREREIDPLKLLRATTFVESLWGSVETGSIDFADAVSQVYSVLSEREAAGLAADPSDPTVAEWLASFIRHR